MTRRAILVFGTHSVNHKRLGIISSTRITAETVTEATNRAMDRTVETFIHKWLVTVDDFLLTQSAVSWGIRATIFGDRCSTFAVVLAF
jgi:hypothetical protein